MTDVSDENPCRLTPLENAGFMTVMALLSVTGAVVVLVADLLHGLGLHRAIPIAGIGLAVIIILVGVFARRRLRRSVCNADLLLCPHCRQNLRGLFESGACPECGTRFCAAQVRQWWAEIVLPLPVENFWRLQFIGRYSPAQRGFDFTFGVALPIVCLMLDPLVFTGGFEGMGAGMLSDWWWLAHTTMLMQICALTACTLLPWKLGPRRPFAAGMLPVGAVFALGLGVVMLPMSIIGLVVLIGVLGLVPFLTAFAYSRCAVRSLSGITKSHRLRRVVLCVLGAFVAAAAPLLVHYTMD